MPSIADFIGTCPHCGSATAKLFNPALLREHFETLIEIYAETVDGRPLLSWLKSDWALFESIDEAHATIILVEILDDGELVRKNFSPVADAQLTNFAAWGDLRAELLHVNRFFPTSGIDMERLKNLLPFLLIINRDIPLTWFRARIQTGGIYDIAQMGAPPPAIASHGRANPAGIPYLYLATDMSTAVSEVRPHTGDKVSIATFKIEDNLKIIDLRHPRRTVSPFAVDEDDIARLRGDLEFLVGLGNELTHPVLPSTAAYNYTPSQYLCEFIKKCGFDGVMYRSSVGSGFNVALFHPLTANAETVVERRVEQVSVKLD